MKTIIIGLGNPVLSDDGVGVQIVRLVQQEMASEQGYCFAEGALGGLNLMERLVGFEHAVIVDAFITGQRQPGSVIACELEELPDTLHTWSSHDTTLTVAMELGRIIGLVLPTSIRIWGIEVRNVDTFGERFSQDVETAIPGVVREVVAYLRGCETS
ncbi:MAG: hydrogenase maturation protease [Magnetococcus sp. YQC-5]